MSATENKLIVETTGDFMLTDVSANQIVEAHRPSLVKRTAFITQRLDNRQLRVVENDVSDDVTDADVEKKWAKGGYNKSQKKPVTPPQAGAKSTGKQPDPVKQPAPIAKGAPQQKDESDDAYLARLDAEAKEAK